MEKELTFKMKVLRFVKKYKKQTRQHTLIATGVLLFLLVIIFKADFYLFQGYELSENTQDTLTVSFENTYYDNLCEKIGNFKISHYQKESSVANLQQVKKKAHNEKIQNILIATFVGDIRFNDYYKKLYENNGKIIINKFLKDYIEESDYFTGNMIGSVTNEETDFLKNCDFSTLSIYNETANDTSVLEKNGISYVGQGFTEENKIVYQQINDSKIATTSTSEGSFVSDLKSINQAKLNANLVIVHINWNDQFSQRVSETQRSIAKAVSDAGADIIIGHNTQVLQPIEIYEDTIILYSLGNFLHGEIYSSTKDSAIVQYIRGKDGNTETLRIIPLSLAHGRPKPTLNIFGVPNRYSIFKVLTRNLPEDVTWINESGILEITLK